MDFKIAFLNGSLDETIYVVQLEGFIKKSQEKKVCRCKSLFMDLSRHLDHGTLDLTHRSIHLDSSNVLMNLGCIRGAAET